MIAPQDLTGVDVTLARRILSVARSIAPCLDSLVDGPGDDDPKPKSDAIAILQGVAGEAKARGSRLVGAQRIGPAAVTYRDVSSWFSPDDRDGLRALCAVVSSAGHPVGTFPKATTAFGRIWPEETT